MANKTYRFTVDNKIFLQEAVLKASYLFTDKYYVAIQTNGENIIEVTMSSKVGDIEPKIVSEFRNELLAQMVRYNLAKKNKNIRELILGRALYSTCIDSEATSEEEDAQEYNYSIDDIAVDWFEANENIEG